MTNEEGNSTDIFEGKAAGNGISFKAAIKSPMPLTLEFKRLGRRRQDLRHRQRQRRRQLAVLGHPRLAGLSAALKA